MRAEAAGQTLITRGPGQGGRVYLTFDDGPDAEWTPQVLDVLAAERVVATFFMIGREVRRLPTLARRVLEAGHEVANHGYAHRHPWTLTARGAQREVEDGAAAIADVVGIAPRFYRPAHGRMRRAMLEAAVQGEQVAVGWSRSAIDWGPFADVARIRRRLKQIEAGEIVLMHDGRNRHNRPAALVRCLPASLAALASRRLVAAPLAWS